MYFGSASYWYLIADANGLMGNELLTEGTTLKIPNAVANSVNNFETFKVYNETEIIGTTSPELQTIQKKKKWYQKLIQIVMIVILVVAAIFAPYLAGMVFNMVGGVLGVLAAVGTGVGIMASANLATQGLAIAADLQDKFDWKQFGKAVVAGAFAGLAGAASAAFGAAAQAGAAGSTGTAAASATTSTINWVEVATHVGIEASRQLVVDGKISSVSGLALAAAGSHTFKNVKDASGAVGQVAKTAQWVNKHREVVGAGLNLIENTARGRDSAMDWVRLASSAVIGNMGGSLVEAGKLNWQHVAVHALGAGFVAQRYGFEAAQGYVGNVVGQAAAQAAFSGGGGTTQSLDNRGLLNSAERAADPAYYTNQGVNWNQAPDQFAAETARLNRYEADAAWNQRIASPEERTKALLRSEMGKAQSDPLQTTLAALGRRGLSERIVAMGQDVDALREGLTGTDLAADVNTVRERFARDVKAVQAMAAEEFQGDEARVATAVNAYVLARYDALNRDNPDFMWTELGIFAANTVRDNLVTVYNAAGALDTVATLASITPNVANNIGGIALGDAAAILREAGREIITGQTGVLTDVGTLSVLHGMYGAQAMSRARFEGMTEEAQISFTLQAQAESARAAGDMEGFYKLQTEAAISMGQHEQIRLQDLWDSPTMSRFAGVNAALLDWTGFGVRPDIYVGTNKYSDLPGTGMTIKAPPGTEDLRVLENRFKIAEHGFRTLDAWRRNPATHLLIEAHQWNLGRSVRLYEPTAFSLKE
jgi:hypothetical protein